MGSFTDTTYSGATEYWTCPAGVNSVLVECIGGGGAGASRSTAGQGGGGGGGAYAASTVSVSAGTVYPYFIGRGGRNVGTPVSPSATTFDTTAVSAANGNNAINNSSTGALGGSSLACIGTTKYSGGRGANGTAVVPAYAGGGGSSADEAGAGGNATASAGGTAPGSGGYGGDGATNSDTDGNAGGLPGGAGGGGWMGTLSASGGDGDTGMLRITWTDPVNVVQILTC